MKHDTITQKNDFFGTEKISKILLQIAPPVMLVQLIQALYNIVDSFFVGQYSANALTALSVIYPLQLIIVALAVGAAAFILMPDALIRVFSKDAEVLAIGHHAFPIIGSSFLPAVVSLIMPVFFQAIGYGRSSLALSLLRQIVCLLPLFWLLAQLGLGYTWLAFPLAELISGGVGLVLYLRVIKRWQST